MGKLLEVDSLYKNYTHTNNKQVIQAINGVSFTLSEGECLGVIGESGCGKSTLAKLLMALEKPSSGTIRFEGELIDKAIKKDVLLFRKKCQMIFQNPFDTFDPRNSVKNILTTALKIHGIGNSFDERVKICMDILEKSGMKPAEDFLCRYPHELSGGQLQRISILRAMLLEPRLIIADEPVSMLDVSVRAEIINMLQSIIKKSNSGMVFISHDIATTRYISNIIAVMYLGQIVEIGLTDDIIQNPQHPYTKILLSNCMSVNPLEKNNRMIIFGEPPVPSGLKEGCYFASRCYKAHCDCKTNSPAMVKIEYNHYAKCLFLGNSE